MQWKAGKLVLVIAAVTTCTTPKMADADTKSLGFAVTSWSTALYQTAGGKQECPDGLAVGALNFYIEAQPKARRDELNRLTRNGELDLTDDVGGSQLRIQAGLQGPGGADICWNPTLVKRPPMRTVRGTTAYGQDLDGNGHGGGETCEHEEFTSPDGAAGIDNQWYRLVGCLYGWRAEGGYLEVNQNGEMRDGGLVTLIEIQGVDRVTEDATVDVVFSRALDPLPKDNVGNILPYGSYRADPQYQYRTRGHLRGGVLETEPVDAHFPFYGNLIYGDRLIRGTRLRLKLSADGAAARGMLAGYTDISTWWNSMRKLGYTQVAGRFDCPSLYEAAHRLADGYRDPTTGQCTALSSAYDIEAVAGFVVHAATRTAGP